MLNILMNIQTIIGYFDIFAKDSIFSSVLNLIIIGCKTFCSSPSAKKES
jgi:hypothetical protein